MKFVVVLRFLGFICVIHLSESFNWTVQTENPTQVTKREYKSLIWEFTLTADEQTKNDLFHFVKWRKFNQSSLDYDLVGVKSFVKVVGSTVYDEPMAPHITIDRNRQATLLINNVRREDGGTYKIEYSVEFDGTLLAYQEFNVTVLDPQPPEIVDVTGDQYVCVGSMVTLSCKATGKPIPNITWTRVWGNGTDSGELPSMDGFYVISNTNRSSNGTYRCSASNGIGNPANQTTEVIVGNPSSVDDVVISSNTAIEGLPYSLSCEVSGDPVPSVSWIKVSNDVHHVGKILNFTSISRNDAASYKCEASNRCGKDSKTESINVFFKPEIKQFTTSAASHTACQNDVISFNCSADANPLVTSYQLFENDSVILDTSGMWSRNMSTRGVFIYKCVANNTYGTGNSEKIAVHLYDPPSVEQVQNITVMEGTHVTKECNVTTGTPPINIFWEDVKSGQVFEGKLLNVTDITRYQTEYRCVANNTCGWVSTTMFIGVHYKPSATSSSSIITLELGEDRSIGCPVDIGNPPAVITWYKGNGTSCHKTTISSTLEVQNASLKDKGWYTCFAKNELGNTTVNLLLLVVSSTVATSSQTTPTGPEECNCPSNDVLLAIIGVLAFTILLLIIYIIWLHKKGAGGKQRTCEDERGVYDNGTGLADIDPSLPDSRKLTQPPAEYMDLIEVNKDNRKVQSNAPGADYVPLDPLTRCWEVPRHHVTIEKIIGKGAFGQVAKGTAVGLRGSPETTTVAIKMLKTNAAESDKRVLMRELDTMKQLKPHPYVIKLLGCVTESEQLLVLIEYVPFGDLLGYLRKSRGLKDTYYKDPDIKPQTNLTSQQLMKFAWQIADGMSYLSSKSIIHRDLAARNVLVGQKETCKVTDFGMARDVQQENIYERKTKGRLPVKWTAYEALLYGKYTTKSDVWSYGVLLYELFTIGGSPYPRMDGRKITNLLQDGYRMPKPQHVDEKLYQIMMNCWKNDPDARPTFTELKNQLKDMETLHKKLINMTTYDKQLYANVEDLIV